MLLIALPVLIAERAIHRDIDFVYFYAAPKIAHLSPESLYDPKVERAFCQQILPPADAAKTYGDFMYPPFVPLLFLPLSHLSLGTAYRVEQAFCAVLYIFGLVLLRRRFFPGEPQLTSILIPLALAYLPFIADTWANGQLSILGFIAISIALCELRAEHPFRSGLALSLCVYKPPLLILLLPMLLFRRQIRVLLGFAAGAFIWAAAATIAYGWNVWLAYERYVRFLSRDMERLRPLAKYVDLTAFFSLLGVRQSASLFAILCGLLTLPFLVAAWRRYEDSPQFAWGIAITWTLILSPYAPVYDTILVIPSMIVSADRLRLGRYQLLVPSLLLLFACSWTSEATALLAHLQLLTVAIALIGSLQIAACLRSGPEQGLCHVTVGARMT